MSAPKKKPTNAQLFSDNYQHIADHPEQYPTSAQDSYCLSTIAFCMAQIADDIHEINRKLKYQK